MKHLLYLVSLLVIATVLFGGTTAAVISVKQNILTIDIGSDRGVEKGMTGKVFRVVKDSASKEDVAIPYGEFIVQGVDPNRSQLYLKLLPGANAGSISQVEFDDVLGPVEPKIAGLQGNIDKITGFIKNKAYADAGPLIEQTEKQYPSDKELALLKAGLDLLLNDNITVQDYIVFKSGKTTDFLLKAVKEKLCAKNKEPNLPPEKYLDANLPIVKNKKEYYEITFPDRNNHVMIYIPGIRLFVDRYEVSTDQVRQAHIRVNPVKFFSKDLPNYPDGCNEKYPAVVSYENAETYCRKYGLRLPTEAEWEFIAGKDKGFKYGWGNNRVDDGGIYRANFVSIDDGHIELAPVDQFADYSSPYGAVNMIGNVSEWVQERYGKGGDFFSQKEDLKITGKSKEPIYVGFRCVMEAK